MPELRTLKKRTEFVSAARGMKYVRPELLVQLNTGEDQGAGVGYTASKKVGGAVVRNRAKRRMRAIAREVLASRGRTGCHYVLVARAQTAHCDFAALRSSMNAACDHLHVRLDRP